MRTLAIGAFHVERRSMRVLRRIIVPLVFVHLVLELIQGARRDTLMTHLIRDYAVPSYDPRTIRYRTTVTLSAEQLGRLSPGPATLRLIGNGSMQWLRTPPPKIRDVYVRIAE